MTTLSSKTPEARVSPADQVSPTFRRLASERSEVSVGPRVPLRQPPLKVRVRRQLKPSQFLASSGDSSRSSPVLPKRPATSNNPNRLGLRLLPKVSSARPQTPLQIKRDSDLRLFPEVLLGHSAPSGEFLPPQLREDLTHGGGEGNFGFFRRGFGSFRPREPKREGRQRRGGIRNTGEGAEP